MTIYVVVISVRNTVNFYGVLVVLFSGLESGVRYIDCPLCAQHVDRGSGRYPNNASAVNGTPSV